ncbi:MAG: hypothetical protein H6765_08985 [Candidatus Peribacteria bacterium]|nr:MAG: hypothetical protein H6765_08985 [Candidatus Peribacteria bacterium]
MAAQHECEYVSEQFCSAYGGVYEECTSACRHDPLADVCTMQCVPVCDLDPHADDYRDIQAALDAAQAVWVTAELQEYAAVQQVSCFCITDYIRPISFDVLDGVIDTSSAMYADDQGGELGEFAPDLLTVEELFTLIQEAIDSKAATITVSYDEDLGYPTSLWIDQSEMMADEERGYSYTISL